MKNVEETGEILPDSGAETPKKTKKAVKKEPENPSSGLKKCLILVAHFVEWRHVRAGEVIEAAAELVESLVSAGIGDVTPTNIAYHEANRE